jgi:hypothetical protein
MVFPLSTPNVKAAREGAYGPTVGKSTRPSRELAFGASPQGVESGRESAMFGFGKKRTEKPKEPREHTKKTMEAVDNDRTRRQDARRKRAVKENEDKQKLLDKLSGKGDTKK